MGRFQLLVWALVGGAAYMAFRRREWELPPVLMPFSQFIYDSASKYQVDPHLIAAVIMVESSGNPRAYREEPRLNTASYGLMQILATTAASQPLNWGGEPQELFVPQLNIDLGTQYLKSRLNKYGDRLGILAYNAGSPYRNGQIIQSNYVAKVDREFNAMTV